MIFKRLREDLDAFIARDPAARSKFEVILCYSGFHAILIHRLTQRLWRWRWHLIARLIAQIGRFLTGIEIHPGARIGPRFVIDHGYGVVIGETSDIGADVTLYQGVTLGGTSPAVDSRSQVSVKRHPTLKDGVILGSGAQILGPITIGEGARVGANSVVTRDVAPGATAVGIPAHAVLPQDRSARVRFFAYGTPAGGCPDPVLQSIESLRSQVNYLLERIADMEKQSASAPGAGAANDGSPAATGHHSASVVAGGDDERHESIKLGERRKQS
jgi:serine O-acetyltransferase